MMLVSIQTFLYLKQMQDILLLPLRARRVDNKLLEIRLKGDD